jgi:peptidoglycan-associated lipoprotein
LIGILAGCAKKEVTLEITRETVVLNPTIESVVVSPSGRLDTREGPQQVKVVLRGDPGLQGTYDVAGRFEGRPLTEVQPGVYESTFVVAKGETGDLGVVGHLDHLPSGAHQSASAGGSLTLFQSEPPEDCSQATAQAFDAALRPLEVAFPFDKIDLSDEVKAKLKSGVGVLESNPLCTLYVLGHADDEGDDHYNFVLSTYRALKVVDYLIELGIPRSRIEPHYFGEDRPSVQGSTDDARARNRRVELRAVNPY